MTLSILRETTFLWAPNLLVGILIESSRLRDSQKTTWLTENYVTHGKLRDSRGPCWDYVGIIFFLLKNYVIHWKLHDLRKTRWWLSRWKKSRQPLVTLSSRRNWYGQHLWETLPKLRKSSITIVFQHRVFSVLDSILSVQARKQYMRG